MSYRALRLSLVSLATLTALSGWGSMARAQDTRRSQFIISETLDGSRDEPLVEMLIVLSPADFGLSDPELQSLQKTRVQARRDYHFHLQSQQEFLADLNDFFKDSEDPQSSDLELKRSLLKHYRDQDTPQARKRARLVSRRAAGIASQSPDAQKRGQEFIQAQRIQGEAQTATLSARVVQATHKLYQALSSRDELSNLAKILLAELEAERTEQDYLRRLQEFDDAWSRATEEDDDYAIDSLEYPLRDYSQTIQILESVLENPSESGRDTAQFNLAWYLSPGLGSRHPDSERSVAYLEALVVEAPQSPHASLSHLLLGRHEFEATRDYVQAARHFQKVVDLEAPDGPWLDEGLYMLGWTQYNQASRSQPDYFYDAMQTLDRLLVETSSHASARPGSTQLMSDEAIQFTAICLADLSIETQNATAIAEEFYRKTGPREHQARVYLKLSETLRNDPDRQSEALDLYRSIIERWPERPETVDAQWEIIQILTLELHQARRKGQDGIAEQEAIDQALQELYSRFGRESDWTRINRVHPDALQRAESYVQATLTATANQNWRAAWAMDPSNPSAGTEAHTERSRELYRRAVSQYREYVIHYPDDADYDLMMFNLADGLHRIGQNEEAEQCLVELLKDEKQPFRAAALYLLQDTQREQLKALHGSLNTVPANASTLREVTTSDGRTYEVKALNPEFQAYVETSDALAAHDFEETIAQIQARQDAEESPNSLLENARALTEAYQRSLEENRLVQAYNSALIFHQHGQFEVSRPRFEAILEHTEWHTDSIAAYSARLIIESYITEGDLDQVQTLSSKFASLHLGNPEDELQNQYFGQMASQSRLVQVAALEQKAKEAGRAGDTEKMRALSLEAARAYDQFVEAHPDENPERLQTALINAALLYEAAGMQEEVQQRIEVLLSRWPAHEQALALQHMRATSLIRSLHYDPAIQVLETVYHTSHSSGVGTEYGIPSLASAAWLREGLGQYQRAAETYEQYGLENPDRADAAPIAFKAGQAWEQVGLEEAQAFYLRYLETWKDRSPDHTLEAHYRRVVLSEKKAETRPSSQSLNDLTEARQAHQEAYFRLKDSISPSSPGHHQMSESALQQFQAQLEEFKSFQFGDNPDKNAHQVISLIAEMTNVQTQSEDLLLTGQISDFESFSGLLVSVGDGWLHLSNAIEENLDLLLPPSFHHDELAFEVFRDEVRSHFIEPNLGRAEQLYIEALSVAAQQKQWSPWQDVAQSRLATTRPNEGYLKAFEPAPIDLLSALATLQTPEEALPSARIEEARERIRINSYDLEAHADLIRAKVDQDYLSTESDVTLQVRAQFALELAHRFIPQAEEHTSLKIQEARLMTAIDSPFEAKQAWVQALQLSPDHPVANAALGLTALSQHDFSEAETRILRAIEASPQSATLHVALGRARLGLGHPMKAIEALEKALKINPENLDPMLELAWIQANSLSEFTEALERVQLYRKRGGMHQEQAETLEAVIEKEQQRQTAEAHRRARALERARQREAQAQQAQLNTLTLSIDSSTANRIKARVKARRVDIMQCYNQGLKTEPALSGRVVVRFDIVSGHPESIEVEAMTDSLERCVHASVKQWVFEGIDSAQGVEISYNLQPS